MALRNETKKETKKETKVMTEVPENVETLDSLQDQMEIPGIDEVPRIKASQGSLIDNEGNEIESPFQGEILSYSTLYVVSTNEDSADARKLTRYTYNTDFVVPDWEDPETVITADEYLEQLKDAGYDKAKIKKYLDIFVMSDDDEMFVIQASPQSVKQFNLYKVLANRKIKKGEITLEQAAHISVVPKKSKLGKFMFTLMKFAMVKGE